MAAAVVGVPPPPPPSVGFDLVNLQLQRHYTHIFVKEALSAAQYRYPEITSHHVSEVLHQFPVFKPVIESTVIRREEGILLALAGYIHVKGVPVPISILLPNYYPYQAPIVFVKQNTAVRLICDCIGSDGKVDETLPYLKEWKHPTSDLVALIQVLIITLQDNGELVQTPPSTSRPPSVDRAGRVRPTGRPGSVRLVDESWELVDPTPDIHALFEVFNKEFFWDTLGPVQVKWNSQMTMCAGATSFNPFNRECIILLSEPLLKLRPRKDLVETLLHEMIHAFIFLDFGSTDREEHGPQFHWHMNRINQLAGTNISVYHSFHDEVLYYQSQRYNQPYHCQPLSQYFDVVQLAFKQRIKKLESNNNQCKLVNKGIKKISKLLHPNPSVPGVVYVMAPPGSLAPPPSGSGVSGGTCNCCGQYGYH